MSDFKSFAEELNAVMVGKVNPMQFGSKNGLCRFNTAVNCEESKCAKCGWNPEVAEQRVTKIREGL